jgi:hypothetical protein
MKLLEWKLRMFAFEIQNGANFTPETLECAWLAYDWLYQQYTGIRQMELYDAMHIIREEMGQLGCQV